MKKGKDDDDDNKTISDPEIMEMHEQANEMENVKKKLMIKERSKLFGWYQMDVAGILIEKSQEL